MIQSQPKPIWEQVYKRDLLADEKSDAEISSKI